MSEPHRDAATLRRLIRTSRIVDQTTRRAWLAVLPYMTAEHRAELRAILTLEGAEVGSPTTRESGTASAAETGR